MDVMLENARGVVTGIWSHDVFRDEVQAVAALAQHHGVPTWLLDWSRYGKVAAYFAASDVVHAREKGGLLAVWALNMSDAKKPKALVNIMDERFPQLRIVELPRAGNPNLHAQAGLFTLGLESAGSPKMSDPVSLVSVDDLVLKTAVESGFELPMMYKLTLPRSEAGTLLKWLAHEPITGATLFPGLDGVARDVRDRRRWPK
jgi:hypothetical protein